MSLKIEISKEENMTLIFSMLNHIIIHKIFQFHQERQNIKELIDELGNIYIFNNTSITADN